MSFRRSVLMPLVAVALTPLISGCFNLGFPGGGVSVNAGPYGANVNVGFPGGGVNVNAGAFGGGVSVAAPGFNMNFGWPGAGFQMPRQLPPQWAPPIQAPPLQAPPVQWAPPTQQLPPIAQLPPPTQMLPPDPGKLVPPDPAKKALFFQGAPEPVALPPGAGAAGLPVGDAPAAAVGFDDLRSR
jgi:hypothetical protein